VLLAQFLARPLVLAPAVALTELRSMAAAQSFDPCWTNW
jgi:hypothetical protein